jgi:hypothetical protein
VDSFGPKEAIESLDNLFCTPLDQLVEVRIETRADLAKLMRDLTSDLVISVLSSPTRVRG